MSQDPWKKAYRMSKGARKRPSGAGGSSLRSRPAGVPLVLTFLIALPLLVGIGMAWFAYANRGTLLPQYADELPEQVVSRIDIPPRQVDVLQLDEGLGIGLAVFGSQGEVVRSTSEWGLEWKLTTLGSGRVRLETDGLRMQAAGDVIESYELELDRVFGNEAWEPWFEDLRNANVEQQLNLREVQGAEELPKGRTILQLEGPRSVQYSGNWRHPAYELEFRDGWLEVLKAGMAIGTATEGEDIAGEG